MAVKLNSPDVCKPVATKVEQQVVNILPNLPDGAKTMVPSTSQGNVGDEHQKGTAD